VQVCGDVFEKSTQRMPKKNRSFLKKGTDQIEVSGYMVL
jgi:hypothetical protein